jgi:dTDP-4-dehydrorhamnose 3,5-epimerase
MNFESTGLNGSYVVNIFPVIDERGWFVRTFCKNEFNKIGHGDEWVQMNHSFTNHAGTIRGMHFQKPPYIETRLIRCIAGNVFDVIIDLRRNSDTFLKWFGVELSAENKKMIYIPGGFAHGFQTLSDNCQLIYLHTAFYAPGFEEGIMYNDKIINISWPKPVTKISERDNNHPLLSSSFEGINNL